MLLHESATVDLQIVVPALIQSEEQVFAPVAATTLTVVPGYLATEEQIFTLTVLVGPLTATPDYFYEYQIFTHRAINVVVPRPSGRRPDKIRLSRHQQDVLGIRHNIPLDRKKRGLF